MASSLVVTLLHTRQLVVSNIALEEVKDLVLLVLFHDGVLVHFVQLKKKKSRDKHVFHSLEKLFS
jgi:hypothetical protein